MIYVHANAEAYGNTGLCTLEMHDWNDRRYESITKIKTLDMTKTQELSSDEVLQQVSTEGVYFIASARKIIIEELI